MRKIQVKISFKRWMILSLKQYTTQGETIPVVDTPNEEQASFASDTQVSRPSFSGASVSEGSVASTSNVTTFPPRVSMESFPSKLDANEFYLRYSSQELTNARNAYQGAVNYVESLNMPARRAQFMRHKKSFWYEGTKEHIFSKIRQDIEYGQKTAFSIPKKWSSSSNEFLIDDFFRLVIPTLVHAVAKDLKMLLKSEPLKNKDAYSSTIWRRHFLATYFDLCCVFESMHLFQTFTKEEKSIMSYHMFRHCTNIFLLTGSPLIDATSYNDFMVNVYEYRRQIATFVHDPTLNKLPYTRFQTFKTKSVATMVQAREWFSFGIQSLVAHPYLTHLLKVLDSFRSSYIDPLFVRVKQVIENSSASLKEKNIVLNKLHETDLKMRDFLNVCLTQFVQLFPTKMVFAPWVSSALTFLCLVSFLAFAGSWFSGHSLNDVYVWIGTVMNDLNKDLFHTAPKQTTPKNLDDLSSLFAAFMDELLRQMQASTNYSFEWVRGYIHMMFSQITSEGQSFYENPIERYSVLREYISKAQWKEVFTFFLTLIQFTSLKKPSVKPPAPISLVIPEVLDCEDNLETPSPSSSLSTPSPMHDLLDPNRAFNATMTVMILREAMRFVAKDLGK